VTIASYRCKPGDVISLKDASRQLALVLEAVQLPERDVPDYLEVDANKMTATFVRRPAFADVPYPVHMDPHLVVEYYSR
jgi:small subunit ribosomal protein S4